MPGIRGDGFVRVTGIRDLQRALRDVADDLPKELGLANQKVAQHIVDEATSAAEALGPLWARAAESMKAARKQRVAAINFGGARHPEALGAEFGAGQNVLRNTSRGVIPGWNQFPPWRGSDTGAGYFLFPTIRREGDRIVDLYGQVLEDLIARHF